MPRPRIRREISVRGDVENFASLLKERKTDLPVFIRDKNFEWLPGKVISCDETNDTVTVRINLPSSWNEETVDSKLATEGEERVINLGDYAGRELPLQNVDKHSRLVGKADMADLPYLHEAAILYNLKDRHVRGVPYTRVGDIVVATNPFKWIDGLYSQDMQFYFADRLVWRARTSGFSLYDYDKGHEPHVYEVSSLAYSGLAVSRQNQSILVTGESGAGKTETIKIVVSHLAKIPSFRKDCDIGTSDEVTQRVSESSLLFEAFGNAKTVRNVNSSRFGKMTKLQFWVESNKEAMEGNRDIPICFLAGCKRETFLLEKSRVVGHDLGERTYHIFYQLLAAPEEVKKDLWDGLVDTYACDFKYLCSKGELSLDEYTDGKSWERTIKDLSLVGIKDEQLTMLMRTLCTILQLGNLEFASDPNTDEAIVSCQEQLEKTAHVFDVPKDTLNKALTKRKMQTSRGELHFALTPANAKDACHSLAKEMYARLFDYLVKTVNAATHTSNFQHKQQEEFGVINLLDIFGFEVFEVNRFEQLCINYANEKLQQKYVMDIFYSTQEEYEAEGIEIFDFSRVDNAAVLELIEGNTGLIALLNDECIRPKGTDEAYVYKLRMVHKTAKAMVKSRINHPHHFGVHHFACPVTYDARKFLERNVDMLPQDLVDCVCKSRNEVISKEFDKLSKVIAQQATKGRRRTSHASSNTVISKFKSQLKNLMNNLANAKTRYIRCIKPNQFGKPRILNHSMVMTQLGSAGLVTAIIISRETFPNQLEYDVIARRYHCLAPELIAGQMDPQAKANRLLAKLLDGQDKYVGGDIIKPFACGKTKVFFRAGMLEVVESKRQRFYNMCTTIIQKWARAYIQRRNYCACKRASLRLHSWWRGQMARLRWNKTIRAVIVIQCFVRCTAARILVTTRRIYRAATLIQSQWRKTKCQSYYNTIKQAAMRIQKSIKMGKSRSNLKYSIAICVDEVRMDHRLKNLRNNLENLDCDGMNDNQITITEESKELLKYLKFEVFKLRGLVSNFKADAYRQKQKNNLLEPKIEGLNASLIVNKKQVSRLTDSQKIVDQKIAETHKENSHLKKTIRELNTQHNIEIAKSEQIRKSLEVTHDKQMLDLKRELKAKERAHQIQLEQLNKSITGILENHQKEIMSLQDKLNEREEAHANDLSRLFDAIDASQKIDLNESLNQFTVSTSRE